MLTGMPVDQQMMVVPTYCHDHPTQHLSKGPVHQRQLQGDERQAHHAEHVSHRQVQDVDVGDRLHFGVTQDDVDDQGVAAEPDAAHDEVDEGDEHGARLVLVFGHLGLGDVQVQVGLVSLDIAVIQKGLWDGVVGRTQQEGPLV